MYFYSRQLTHNKRVDNMSRVRDLFIDRTWDCSQSGRTIWCSRLVQKHVLPFVLFWVNSWKNTLGTKVIVSYLNHLILYLNLVQYFVQKQNFWVCYDFGGEKKIVLSFSSSSPDFQIKSFSYLEEIWNKKLIICTFI